MSSAEELKTLQNLELKQIKTFFFVFVFLLILNISYFLSLLHTKKGKIWPRSIIGQQSASLHLLDNDVF